VGAATIVCGLTFFFVLVGWFVVVASRVSPRRATHFLLLRQKKASKEKASRRPGRFAVPCAAQPGHTARSEHGIEIEPPYRREVFPFRTPWNRLCRATSVAP
jgi:hypothetical protein